MCGGVTEDFLNDSSELIHLADLPLRRALLLLLVKWLRIWLSRWPWCAQGCSRPVVSRQQNRRDAYSTLARSRLADGRFQSEDLSKRLSLGKKRNEHIVISFFICVHETVPDWNRERS